MCNFVEEGTGSQLKFIDRNVKLDKGKGLNLDKAEGRMSGNKVATVSKEICFISGKTHTCPSGIKKGAWE